MGYVSARIIEVIEIVVPAGRGTDADPYRQVTVYFSKDGVRLADNDDWSGHVEVPSE